MTKPVDKEELILKTAMGLFVERGWHGTKMQEIADRAGINKALLHYYFRSKEKLYKKIFEYLIWNNIGETIKIFREQTDLPFEEYIKSRPGTYGIVSKSEYEFFLKHVSQSASSHPSLGLQLRYH